MASPRILLAGGGTGGHLYPALNLAAAFGRLAPDVECVFLGGRRGLEARVLPDAGYEFRLLPLQPLYRQRPWRNWRLFASAPTVLAGVRRAFRDFDPRLVVGTGGYVAGPALAGARLHGVPTAIQEQNAAPGLVTRLFAPGVDQIHLGYPEAEDRLRVGGRTRLSALGNPVAPSLDGATDAGSSGGSAAARFDWPAGRNLLVFGGSQGALGLNRAFLRDLEWAARDASAWPDGVSVVWIAGPAHAAELSARTSELPFADRVRVVSYIDDLGRQLDRVTLALCRAGAMSLAELCAAGRPAVLVPLPTSAGGHQLTNARALAAAGAAEVREEEGLEAGELWSLCRDILTDDARLTRMSAAAASRGRPHAALDIAREMLTLMGRRAA
ncbi:UDP-N-acetylglucosamine--N-acetylmuramyl-(pentapeptide) pyrophosphoryl-undecaprenol N-acetylglucosamine transferase [Candidatus Palauibacter soopunensis]|uniref:UDP-N-acetylglucosamine--N-acetylmuramyl- (pentapeptide) pyrophosphoryl-undecaprenol N-acetylglucosamine transferase n=1 Tax=Candidatus Palauibacter soopunensis TaxID=3056739 RepID=UPI002386964D|nr:UDP-N-acetylglucosamine--N-acetylmuramyl-(pentapeptide) pyrophosphoryl-undecaprenol N-acetylglucosamine transferase [Candidatus Palauibacter soopunensis]MDE2878733.1 UDP-N-acetylglucosamine--N-acetylmuramyl-(pentapeptide) pyrophosphoryl-undecaprenol N-acetylglucosamine transferase [Candidatus Palauibacter soopunensis]